MIGAAMGSELVCLWEMALEACGLVMIGARGGEVVEVDLPNL